MEYVIPIVLVVLLVGGFVTYLVLNATKKSGPVADSDADAHRASGATRRRSATRRSTRAR